MELSNLQLDPAPVMQDTGTVFPDSGRLADSDIASGVSPDDTTPDVTSPVEVISESTPPDDSLAANFLTRRRPCIWD